MYNNMNEKVSQKYLTAFYTIIFIGTHFIHNHCKYLLSYDMLYIVIKDAMM